jgi:Transposase DDE domain
LCKNEKGSLIRKTAEKRNRCFSPLLFLLAMIRLVGSDSLDGVQILLDDLFGNDLKRQVPTDSAFSQFRATVSYIFFKNLFEKMISVIAIGNRLPTWNGLRFYGVDGDVYSMNRTDELVQAGYSGQQCSTDRETYLLKMYVTLKTCLISGATLGVHYSQISDEIGGAVELLANAGPKDVFIVDRLYFSERFISAVTSKGCYYICRLRVGFNNKTKEFVQSGKNQDYIEMYGTKVRIVKIDISEHDCIVLATNLPSNMISVDQLGELYTRRWGSESANKDTTSNHSLDHFHSRKLNGILQEIYAMCIFRLIRGMVVSQCTDLSYDFLNIEYRRPNFKEVARNLLPGLATLIVGGLDRFWKNITKIIERSMETRRHRTRSYPRTITGSRTKDYASRTVPLENTR